MILYFEFEDRPVQAEVLWPKNGEDIEVHLTDSQLLSHFPADHFFEIKRGNQVSYTIENPTNKRLIDLQIVISRKLQEFVNKF